MVLKMIIFMTLHIQSVLTKLQPPPRFECYVYWHRFGMLKQSTVIHTLRPTSANIATQSASFWQPEQMVLSHPPSAPDIYSVQLDILLFLSQTFTKLVLLWSSIKDLKKSFKVRSFFITGMLKSFMVHPETDPPLPSIWFHHVII